MSIEFNNIKIAYNKDDTSLLTICENFSYKADAGEIIGILGANGSGKTTLINAILGYVNLKNGTVKLPNEAKIAYIPQDYNASFFCWTNLYNNILLLQAKFYKRPKHYKNRIDKLKQDFGIDFSFTIKPKECSGGMLQKVAILRALFLEPNILLADEPFSALDIASIKQFVPVLREYIKTNNIITFIVLHNIDDLLLTCDKIIYIPDKPFTTDIELNDYYIVKVFNNKNIDVATISNVTETKLKVLFEN